jgi:uncharacterized delta-60 repeat protein
MHAASGDVDPMFIIGTGANGRVTSLALQADGKMLIGGHFTSINGTNRNYIARLNADGVLDATFRPVLGPDYYVYSVALQTNGQVLIGGAFIHVDGSNRGRIARLNTDGSLDNTFMNGTLGADGSVTAIALQSDNKVIVDGSFTTMGGYPSLYLARLNTNGITDESFGTNFWANGAINAVAIQPDGRMILGGYFTSINGTNRNYVARLMTNGTLDETFNPGSGANAPVLAVAMQPDGKVLLGGLFTTINGTNRNSVARLNANGTLDNFFDPGSGADAWINSFAIQPNGQIIIGGAFSYVNGTNQYYLARLHSNGSLDADFFSDTGPNSYVYSVLKLKDGKVLVGGEFTQMNGTNKNHFARLLGNPVTLQIERSGPKTRITWEDSAYLLQSQHP